MQSVFSSRVSSCRLALPYATLFVNCLGCLLIGFLATLAEQRQIVRLDINDLRLFLIVGLLGGFTTFSAFGCETMKLVRDEQTAMAFVNVAAHIILGLGGVWC